MQGWAGGLWLLFSGGALVGDKFVIIVADGEMLVRWSICFFLQMGLVQELDILLPKLTHLDLIT